MKDMKNFKFYWDSANGPNIKIDVPGFSRNEIRVKLSRDFITVSASKKKHEVEKKRGFYREGAFSSSFSKSISLPHKINPEDFEVAVSDGKVLLKRKKKAVKEKSGV